MSPETFRQEYPNLLFLDPSEPEQLTDYLRKHKVLAADEPVISVSKAGEGNMNCVVRVTTPRQSLIVKQARPWVEKYPQFAAPWDRACREMEFYQLTASVPSVASAMPQLWLGDPEARVLVLQDLGNGGDFSIVYRGQTLTPATLDSLADFLSTLHAVFARDPKRPSLVNREMRALNHAHIFEIPLAAGNGLKLELRKPGLQALADSLKHDTEYCAEVGRLGSEVYLVDGPCLLHGDFFPGSLVRTPHGPRVIDPEFCFFGRPEYDVAVFLAHLFLSEHPQPLRERFRARYLPPVEFDDCLMRQLAGVEIMRRLIGYAQLPLAADLEAQRNLLERSRRLVLGRQLES